MPGITWVELSLNSTTLIKKEENRLSLLYRLFAIGLATALFLVALNLLGQAFFSLSDERVRAVLSVTYNPFISLFIGLLVTSIIQSSSTVTSLAVTAVAAGSLDMASAVPMIMGANIGTTLTSSLVSLGYIAKRNEFRRAIAAGTLHNFFNILTTLLLLPLELQYGLVSGLAIKITDTLVPFNDGEVVDSFQYGFWNNLAPINWLVSQVQNKVVLLLLAFLLLFISIKLLAKTIYDLLSGNIRQSFQQFLFSSPLKSFTLGTLITATVQSSSITTPLVVPLVAAHKISLRQAFPYILGANVGTTFTAIIAALYHSNAAISLAITHLLFNLLGVLIFLPFKPLREIPIRLAKTLGRLTNNNRIIGFAYILVVFFLLPFTLIYLTQPKNPLQVNKTKQELPIHAHPQKEA